MMTPPIGVHDVCAIASLKASDERLGRIRFTIIGARTCGRTISGVDGGHAASTRGAGRSAEGDNTENVTHPAQAKCALATLDSRNAALSRFFLPLFQCKRA
jgi:hypothetical protein